MKRCPKCQDAPDWHLATNTTRRRSDGRRYYLISGCPHAMEFAKAWGVVPREDIPARAAQWDEEAERLFALVTEHWTDPQRVSFRVKLQYVRLSTELEMHTEEPAAVDGKPNNDDGESSF